MESRRITSMRNLILVLSCFFGSVTFAQSNTPLSASSQSSLKVWVGAKAKTWKEANDICKNSHDQNRDWKLPSGDDLVTIFSDILLQKNNPEWLKANTFAAPSEPTLSFFMIWIQGNTPEQTAKFKEKDTVLCAVDADHLKISPFDLATDLSELKHDIALIAQFPSKEEPGTTPEMKKAAKDLVAGLEVGVTTLCVSEK